MTTTSNIVDNDTSTKDVKNQRITVVGKKPHQDQILVLFTYEETPIYPGRQEHLKLGSSFSTGGDDVTWY